MSVADEIDKLNQLKADGAITEVEYQRLKTLAMDDKSDSLNEADYRTWAMFLHFSQLCGYLVPLAGLIVPVVLWQMKKDESEYIDRHGKLVVNWIITVFIYAIISAVLCFVVIGVPMLWVLGIVAVVFPIIGGIKANEGAEWAYPGSMTFFK